MPIAITELHYYPIKSCGGTSLDRAKVGSRGIEFDRGWLLVDDQAKTLTQRDLPSMALIKPSLPQDSYSDREGLSLTLSAPGMPQIKVAEKSKNAHVDLEVWDDPCSGVDQGDEAAAWFSEFLKKKVRLIRMADECVRKIDPKYATADSDQVSFADGYPLLIVSQASLDDLNQRLQEPLPMDRFRPNIVVAGCNAFAEDKWTAFESGGIRFDCVKLCARCVVTTIDQKTTKKSVEPLHTLAIYRNQNNKLMFGQNLIHKSTGEIAVGDLVTVLQ